MKRRNRNRPGFRRAAARAFVLAPLTFLLVAGAGCPSLFESKTPREVKIKQAEVGKDGPGVIGAANTVVNAYAALAANVAAGATSITFDNADANFDVLEVGDLLLIIQMQGATITTTDTSAYGTVTALGGAGRYELVGVRAVSGNQISLACRLKNAYTVAGNTQIVRVPQYTTLSIPAGTSITAPAWNGTTGGVVAVHAQGTVTLAGTGKIDVSGKGFRGGAVDTTSNTPGDSKVTLYRSTDPDLGAEKGESIAGYQAGYSNGRYGRGAPANGGGGGNAHNAGGGGGANAASGLTWTGQGVMTGCTPTTPGPWALDDAYTSNPATDKCSKSEGGGRGGYSFSYADQDPTAVAPGTCTGGTSWAGNCRQQVGGWGGRPVPNSVGGADPRLFMGGGGGAGDGDNTRAGRGGNGGGLVFLIAGSVAGPATAGIVASGEAGGAATVTGNEWNDAAGGGGGGGTIVVSAATIGSIAITASGGPGGSQSGGRTDEAEGPGGGGGGGYVAVTGTSTATIAAAAGLAGTTDQAVMTDFDENGATAGNAGVTNGSAAGLLYCGFQLTTIATHPDAVTSSTTGVFTFTNPVAGVTYECRLYTTTPTAWGACNGVDGGTGGGYTAVGLTDGSRTFEVRATDPDGNVEDPPATFTWTVDTVAPNTTIATKPGATSGDRTADFTFESSETPATFECALDGATTWTACTATYTTPPLTDGDHTLAVRAKDAAGNVDATPATHEWNINTGYPLTTIATHPNAASNDPTGDFTFTNTRDPVTYECRLDGATAWTACGPSYTTPALDDGSHTLRVRATASALDGGVFVEDPPVVFTWTVDTVPPETEITSNPPGLSTSPTATFTFDSNEDPVTYECKIDSGDWAACTATFTTASLPNGVHTLSVRSKDAAGNVDGTPATSTWEIAAMVIDGGAIDGGGRDVSVGPGIDGGPPAIDGGRLDVGTIDGGRTDGPRLDGAVVDGGVRDVVVDGVAGPDTRPPGPEPGSDAAVPTEPGRDAAVNQDTPVIKADAAIPPPATDIKVLGGGFCAIAPSGNTSPAAFLLLALAGLALLRRKRR